jgi:SRSO17 transposase
MVGRTSDWEDELGRWLKPFLHRLGHKARRRMCPLYVAGLIGPGDRKSVQPMAERLVPGDYDQLHHFIAAGVWDTAPFETELLIQADQLVGGSDAVLVIDDTAVPKKGKHSVGVAAQYASALGKTANCQTLVSLTLARGEVPVMVALRLFLPESWTSNPVRLKRAGVPVEYRTARTKPEIALAEIDRVIAAGVRFGCVLADAGYGLSAPLRWRREGIRRAPRTHPPDNEHRFDQNRQVGQVLDKLPDPRLELHLPNHADLKAEVAQRTAQVVLKGDGLGQQQLAMGQQHPQFLTA